MPSQFLHQHQNITQYHEANLLSSFLCFLSRIPIIGNRPWRVLSQFTLYQSQSGCWKPLWIQHWIWKGNCKLSDLFYRAHFCDKWAHCSFKHNYNLQTLILNQTSRVTIPEGCGIELPTRSIWPMSNFPNSAIQVSSIKLVLNTPLPVSQLELALSYLDIINSYIWMINILMLKGFVMLFVLSLPGILYLKYTDYFRDPDAAAQNFTMVSRRCRGWKKLFWIWANCMKIFTQ